MIPIAVYSHFSAIRSRLKGLGPASALGSELLQPTTFIVKLLLYVVLVLCTTSSFNYFPVLAPIFSNEFSIKQILLRKQRHFGCCAVSAADFGPSSISFSAQPVIIYLSQQPAAPSCEATEAHRYEVSLS